MTTTTPTLYVSRKYPPSVGGMERLAQSVATTLWEIGSTRLITLGKSQIHLIWWLPITAVRLLTRRTELIVFGDVFVAALLWPFHRSKRTAVVAHGLDVTFDAPGYSVLVRLAFRRIDRFIAISVNTASLLTKYGVDEERISVVYPGVALPEQLIENASDVCRARIGVAYNSPLLLYVGRLVPRKGIGWFVEEVFPKLRDDIHLVIIGTGPDAPRVMESTKRLGLTHRIHLLGAVPDEARDLFMQGADLVVMPNVPVESDPEGFGLVGVEATLRHTPVLGTRIDAVTEALGDGACGYLTEPLDGDAMAEMIDRLLIDRIALASAGHEFATEAATRFAESEFPEKLRGALGLSFPDRDAWRGSPMRPAAPPANHYRRPHVRRTEPLMGRPAVDHEGSFGPSLPLLRRSGAFLSLAVLSILVWIIATNVGALREFLTKASVPMALASMGPILISHLVTAMLGLEILKAYDTERGSLRRLYGILFISNVAKYIPGGVWQLGSQYHLSRREGLSGRASILLWVDMAVLTSGLAIGVSAAALAFVQTPRLLPRWTLVLLALLAFLGTHPRVRRPVLKLLRLTVDDARRIDSAATWLRSTGTALIGALLLGVHGILLIQAMYPESLVPFAASVAAFLAAWAIGFLAFFVPNGFGVREGVLVLLLSPWLPGPAAVALALASRLVSLGADMISGLIAVMIQSRSTSRG